MMITRGKALGVATFALLTGFSGGLLFISSGIGFTLIDDSKGPGKQTSTGARPGPSPGSRPMNSEPYGESGGGSSLRANRNDLLPSVDHEWVVEPMPILPTLEMLRPYRLQDALVGASHTWHLSTPDRLLHGHISRDQTTGDLRLALAEFTRRGKSPLDLVPAFFDRAGRHYRPTATHQTRTPNGPDVVQVSEFTLTPSEPVPLGEIVYFGFERALTDAERQGVESAQAAAREHGVAILPPPRIGEPYDFDLTTVDGQRLRTSDFRGKAIVIAVWQENASTVPIVASLGLVRKKYSENEVIIIGISFADSVAQAKETMQRWKAKGPLVVVPNDPKIRALWATGGRILRFPFTFQVDRDGILRFTSLYRRHIENFRLERNLDIEFGRKPFPNLQRWSTGPPRPYLRPHGLPGPPAPDWSPPAVEAPTAKPRESEPAIAGPAHQTQTSSSATPTRTDPHLDGQGTSP